MSTPNNKKTLPEDWENQPTRIIQPKDWEVAPTQMSSGAVDSDVDQNRRDIEAALFGEDDAQAADSDSSVEDFSHLVHIEKPPHEDVEDYLFDENRLQDSEDQTAEDEEEDTAENSVHLRARNAENYDGTVPQDQIDEFHRMLAERRNGGTNQQTGA